MPKFTIVFERTGTLTIEAESYEDAMSVAEDATSSDIDWNPDFYMNEEIICEED